MAQLAVVLLGRVPLHAAEVIVADQAPQLRHRTERNQVSEKGREACSGVLR